METSLSEKPETAQGESRRQFLNEAQLLETVLPVCRRTLIKLRREGVIPFVQVGRRILYHEPSVREALLRRQRGL